MPCPSDQAILRPSAHYRKPHILVTFPGMDRSVEYTQVRGQKARFLRFDGDGPPAHFFSANGFPTKSYRQLLEPLSQHFQLTSLSLRACWPEIGPSRKQTSWSLYADDLIAFLESNFNEPVIALGHSQGASSSVIAAAKRPDLFKEMILLEPASMSPFMHVALRSTPYVIKKGFEPYRSSLRGEDIWESKEQYFQHLRAQKAFRRISDSGLKDHVAAALTPTSDGRLRRTFPVDWETSNYTLAEALPRYVKQLKMPIRVLAGKPSLFFSEKARQSWKKLAPQTQFQTFHEYGHLLPLEAPELCAKTILGKD